MASDVTDMVPADAADEHHGSDAISSPGLRFGSVCDDVILEVFKYLDLKQRTLCEQINSRFGTLMPLLTTNLDDFRFRRYASLSAREEEDMYLRLVKKSPKVKQLSFEVLRQDQLLVAIFAGDETVESYTQRLVDNCSDCDEIRVMVYSCSEFALYAALKFVAALGSKCKVRKIELHLDYNELDGMSKLGEKLNQLMHACPKLVEVNFVFYGPYDGGEWSADSSREARKAFDDLWTSLAAKLQLLRISYNDADIFFGHRHWTAYSFPCLEQLTPQELTGGYIRNIAENCPILKKLVIETINLQPLEHLLQMNCLEDLSWEYFDQESDSQREENKRLFDKFIRTSGHRLRRLDLKIPFQANDFFEHVHTTCTTLKSIAVSFSGTPKRGFRVESVTSLPALRKLAVASKLSTEQLGVLLDKCPKLKSLKFYVPSYEKLTLPRMKDLILSYARSHPKRTIDVKIRFCGGSYFTEFEKDIKDNCTVYIDNGRQINDYWDD